MKTNTIALLASGLALFAGPVALGAEPVHEIGGETKHNIAGDTHRHRSSLAFEIDKSVLSIYAHGSLTGTFETAVPVDRYGSQWDPGLGANGELVIGLKFDSLKTWESVRLTADLAVEIIGGPLVPVHGMTNDALGMDLSSDAYPGAGEVRLAHIHRAFLGLSLSPEVHIRAGIMGSHWGLGLLANDGEHGWTPGSARFSDPRDGDRVLRAMVIAGPFTSSSVLFAASFDLIGYGGDRVAWDDTLREGDTAIQGAMALQVGAGGPTGAGIYAVYRDVEAESGRGTAAFVIDITARTTIDMGEGHTLMLAGEAAVVTGSTTLAPSVDFDTHDILQVGAVGQIHYNGNNIGGLNLDVLYASGDDNPDDGIQTAFKADRNMEQGLLLHRYVATAQSARAVATASDPALVAVPASDLDRFPTRGSATNTISIAPRVWVRPLDGFEIYAGPLIAFAPQRPSDPLSSKVGGSPKNALGGDGGTYVGTEMDIGIRYTALIEGVEFQLAVEGAGFFPGGAFKDAAGSVTMDPVWGGRASLGLHL